MGLLTRDVTHIHINLWSSDLCQITVLISINSDIRNGPLLTGGVIRASFSSVEKMFVNNPRLFMKIKNILYGVYLREGISKMRGFLEGRDYWRIYVTRWRAEKNCMSPTICSMKAPMTNRHFNFTLSYPWNPQIYFLAGSENNFCFVFGYSWNSLSIQNHNKKYNCFMIWL